MSEDVYGLFRMLDAFEMFTTIKTRKTTNWFEFKPSGFCLNP